MSFSPDERRGNRRPEIRFRNPPERQPVHRLKNRPRKILLWSQLLLLPCFQQLPHVAEPVFQVDLSDELIFCALMELYGICYLDVWEEGNDFHLKLRGM